MKCQPTGALIALTWVLASWALHLSPCAAGDIQGGVYKSLQTRGNAGKRVASFYANLYGSRPVYNVVELDLYRGESITVTCPSSGEAGGNFFPFKLTAYYKTPPNYVRPLGVAHYSNRDLENELNIVETEMLGRLEEVSDSLILIPHGKHSRRLSFLWKGQEVSVSTTLHFQCVKKDDASNKHNPSALIIVRVVADHPDITNKTIDVRRADYLPKGYDMVYTKEYSAIDDLIVRCAPMDGDAADAKTWRALKVDLLPNNIWAPPDDHDDTINRNWEQMAAVINAKIDMDNVEAGVIRVTSEDISSIFYTYQGAAYINCRGAQSRSNRIFNLAPSGVSTVDLLMPNEHPVVEGEDVGRLKRPFRFEYKITNGQTVAIFCPVATHNMQPNTLMAGTNEASKEILLHLPNTKISRRGASLLVIDPSNSSAVNDVTVEIRCMSKTEVYTSYVFALSSKGICIFDDNMHSWRQCKRILFPTDELLVRCPRKTGEAFYGLMPRKLVEAYIRVDDEYVKDRHVALTREIVPHPNGDLHKITFLGLEGRALIRDEIHYECSDQERENYIASEFAPTVVIKLIGHFEEVDANGKIIINLEHLVKPLEPPKLFYVLLSKGTTRRIVCPDFFAEGENARIYPQGKWETFDDIPRFFSGILLGKIGAKQIHETRAIQGLTMKRDPSAMPTYVELTLEDDYILSSRSDNAFYFVCSRRSMWDTEHSEAAVVQVYIPSNIPDYYGVGVERGLFQLDHDYKGSKHDDATFNVMEHKVIAMHCPKGPDDIIYPQCYDMRMQVDGAEYAHIEGYGERNALPGIIDTNETKTIKSIWFITAEYLRSSYQDGDVDVQCSCLDEKHKTLAVMRLTSVEGFHYAGMAIGILAAIIIVVAV